MFNNANVIDITAASGTLQQIGETATPIFAATIQPAAFIEGILVGGVLVAALMAAVVAAVKGLFRPAGSYQDASGHWHQGDARYVGKKHWYDMTP